jgi:putative transposase
MADSTYTHKRHNVAALVYCLVCPAKYRRVVFSAEVDSSMKAICLELEKHYELVFLDFSLS